MRLDDYLLPLVTDCSAKRFVEALLVTACVHAEMMDSGAYAKARRFNVKRPGLHP